MALVPLLVLARDVAHGARPIRAGAGWGFVSGAVFFGLILVWIERFGVLPLVLLVAVQALSVSAFVAGMAAWGGRISRPLAAVVWWVALEAVRSQWPLGGFPWGVLGYTQHAGGPLLPVARAFGVLGVSAAAVAVAAGIEEGWHRWRAGRGWRVAAAPLVVALLVVTAAVALGGRPPPATGDTIDIAAVQGNDIELPPVVDRLNRVRVERIVERMLVATERMVAAGGPPPEVTVWPENSLDAGLQDDPAIRASVQQALSLLDGPLLAGALIDGPGGPVNAIVELSDGPEIADVYVKRRLVPFGEYVPLRRWLDWFPPLEQVPRDYVPGDEPGVFRIAGATIGPVTCYESIFPELVHSQVRAGADVLIVSTNNASFGRSPASRQHLAFSQLRAVETGRWVLHAGISGISAVVDPQGQLSQQTELFTQAIVRADLPLVREQTLATRVGWLVGPLAVGASVLGLAWLTLTRRASAARR